MFNVEDYMKLDYPEIIRTIEENDEKYLEVSIAELPGFFVYVDDYSEIKEEVDASKKEWFAAQIEMGREIPRPIKKSNASGRVTLRMSKFKHDRISKFAALNGVSLNQALNDLIDVGFENILEGQSVTEIPVVEKDYDSKKTQVNYSDFISSDKRNESSDQGRTIILFGNYKKEETLKEN